MKKFLVFLLSFTQVFAFGQTTLRTDKVLIGKSGSTTKEIIFDQGSGGANPRFRFNQANGKIEFSTDGTTFYTFATPNGSELLQGKTLETLNLDSQSIAGATTIADLSSSKALAIITGSTLTNLTGIAGGVAGKVITVLNATTGDLTIKHEDSGATAANRITLAGMTQLKVKINTAVDLVYTSSNRWVMKGGSGNGGGGSSSSSGFISNGAFEDGLTGWTCFKSTAAARPSDSMVFNTGQAVTLVADQTSPLNGTAHGKFTKDAANRQGEGCYFDFSIPEAYKTKVLKVEGSYKVLTGTFTAGIGGTSPVDSDLIVYIYDRTNNKVIEPNNFRLLSNSTSLAEFLENMEFQATTSTQYRLMFYVASTSASAFEIALDDVDVIPVKKGSASLTSSGWKDFPSVAAGTLITATTTNPTYGTVVSNKAQYRYDGPDVEIKWDFRQSTAGTIGSGTYLFNIPSSICVIDTSKVKANSSIASDLDYSESSVGSFRGIESYTLEGTPSVFSQSQLKIFGIFTNGTTTTRGAWSSTNFHFGIANTSFSLNAKVPCVGRDSAVNRSSEDDMRVLVAEAYASSQSVANATNTALDLTSTSGDTHGGFDLAANLYRVQISGYYYAEGIVTWDGTGTGSYFSQILKNGAIVEEATAYQNYSSASQITVSSKTLRWFNQGDTISVNARQSTGAAKNTVGANSSLKIFRISGPQSIAATEQISASYWMSANTSVSSGVQINFDSREYETHGGLVTTGAGTWKFTAPVNGEYEVSGFLNQSTGSASAVLMLYKNGSPSRSLAYTFSAQPTTWKTKIRLNQGEYVDVRPMSAIPVAGGLLSGANYTSYIQISRTGL